MTSVSKFNLQLDQLIISLREMNLPNLNKNLDKIETLLEIRKMNSKIIIKNFQLIVLRDATVKAVLKKDVDFFIHYNPNRELEEICKANDLTIDTNDSAAVVEKIKELIVMVKEDESKTNTIFKYLTLLCYFAYEDLNIDPKMKLRSLAA